MFKKQFDLIHDIFKKSNHALEFGTSYSGFARFLGVSVGKVQAWREGGQWPKAQDIALLHRKMGFSYEWLVTGEGDPFDTPQKQTAFTPPEPEIDMRELLARLEAVEKKIDGSGDDTGEGPYAPTQAALAARGVRRDGN